jgi:hypothetical protein
VCACAVVRVRVRVCVRGVCAWCVCVYLRAMSGSSARAILTSRSLEMTEPQGRSNSRALASRHRKSAPMTPSWTGSRLPVPRMLCTSAKSSSLPLVVHEADVSRGLTTMAVAATTA